MICWYKCTVTFIHGMRLFVVGVCCMFLFNAQGFKTHKEKELCDFSMYSKTMYEHPRNVFFEETVFPGISFKIRVFLFIVVGIRKISQKRISLWQVNVFHVVKIDIRIMYNLYRVNLQVTVLFMSFHFWNKKLFFFLIISRLVGPIYVIKPKIWRHMDLLFQNKVMQLRI